MLTMCINYWRYGSIRIETIDWIADTFSGWGYYKMMWSKKKAKAMVMAMAQEITLYKGTNMFDNSIFIDVHKIVKKHWKEE